MKKLHLLLILSIITSLSSGQSWTEMMNEPGRNFYEIQAAFNAYWKDRDVTEKGKGYKQFRRWAHFVEPRVYPSGDLSLISNNWENYERFLRANTGAKLMSSSSTWTAIGPMGALSGSTTRKAGRDNFITFHPTTATTYWCGAPAGGLWKTTNNGSSWTTTTDNLSVIGCSDLAIDSINPLIMYMATGDGDAGDTYCIGVLKSTDGGVSWNTTGLTFPVSAQRQMRRLIINKTNPQILIAATNVGVYRTTDGAATWTQVSNINAFDVEFKPGDPSTVYAAGTSFYRSTNGGASFTIVSSGITTTGVERMNIAVTPADPNYVYVLAASASSHGLFGVYRSVNSGAAFSLMASSPDLLANGCSLSASGGGQGWYDLAFAASPLNKNEVVVGGINVWRSINGGTSWGMIGCWVGTSNPPFLHADQHELEYTPGGVLYACNDGGVFEYTGTAWTDRTNPRNIAQIYKIGLSSISPNLLITGHQDNGTNIYNGSTYAAALAGDGMDCFIDRTTNSTMYASQYDGNFYRSTNGGGSWSNIVNGLAAGTGAWVSPWKQDPVVATRLYAGYSILYVSNDQGTNWTPLTSPGGAGSIVEFAVSPSNNQVIYIIRGTSIRKSTDGGNTWTVVTGIIPVASAAPSFITIDPTNENHVWVTCSGYSASNKVFQTTNGGASWTNISYNLPNLPANCSVLQPGGNGMIYVGMDVGVYYKDNSSNVWTLYNSGLPNAPLSDMEISPAAPTKLRAATYGRGVYEVDLVQPSGAPTTSFAIPNTLICGSGSVTLLDLSSNFPSAWGWTVTPSANVQLNAAAQNPTLNFTAPGTYTVSFISSNSFGSGTAVTKTITVLPAPSISVAFLTNTVCIDEVATMNVSGANSYTLTGTGAVLSGTTITFSSNVVASKELTVRATDLNGCKTSTTVNVEVVDCTGLDNASTQPVTYKIFPNPASNKLTIESYSDKTVELSVEIFDAAGRLVMKQSSVLKKEKHELQLNISILEDGVYFVKLNGSDGSSQTSRIVKE
jgi:hypothetical protein